MAISVRCTNPDCGKACRVQDEFGGKSVKCPACGQRLTVPTQKPATPAGESAEPAYRPGGPAPRTAVEPPRPRAVWPWLAGMSAMLLVGAAAGYVLAPPKGQTGGDRPVPSDPPSQELAAANADLARRLADAEDKLRDSLAANADLAKRLSAPPGAVSTPPVSDAPKVEKPGRDGPAGQAKGEGKETWRLRKGTATVLVGGYEIVIVKGFASYKVRPADGEKLVQVEWQLTATEPDPGAKDLLAKARKAEKLWEDDDKKLPGTYRMFDAGQVFLLGSDKERVAVKWIHQPIADWFCTEEGKRFGNAEETPKHWHATSQMLVGEKAPGRFVGLLEVGHETTVKAIFSVPQKFELKGLKLQLGSEPPLDLR